MQGIADGRSAELGVRADEAWPHYAPDEIAAAAAVLASGKVNQWTGPDVFAFEVALARRLGVGQGVALANGSVALELALRALGIGPGDEVIVTPRSFVASASCVMLVGATPVFADVDPDSGAITAEAIRRVATERTRAIIPVHLGGWPADMPAIMRFAKQRGLKVIEDCAQSPGAAIGGRPVGSYGDAAAYSFCQDKILTTGGEGGFVSFRNKRELERAWSFKDHGKNRERALEPASIQGEFRWLHDQVGTNWRLTGPQAAIGLVQLGKLEEWLRTRERYARIWMDALGGLPNVRVPAPPAGVRNAWYKLYFHLEVPQKEASRTRRLVMARARAEGLRLFTGACPEIYRERAFRGLPNPDCPVARRLGETSLMVEVHPTLRPDLLQRRAERLAAILKDIVDG